MELSTANRFWYNKDSFREVLSEVSNNRFNVYTEHFTRFKGFVKRIAN